MIKKRRRQSSSASLYILDTVTKYSFIFYFFKHHNFITFILFLAARIYLVGIWVKQIHFHMREMLFTPTLCRGQEGRVWDLQ